MEDLTETHTGMGRTCSRHQGSNPDPSCHWTDHCSTMPPITISEKQKKLNIVLSSFQVVYTYSYIPSFLTPLRVMDGYRPSHLSLGGR